MKLKKRELSKFKKRLIEIQCQLIHTLQSSTENVKATDESRGYSQHQADEGTDDFDRTISLELSCKERDILQHIERALEKIEEDTYGICDITGKEIPMKRLEAVPYAIMTVEAQEQLEKGLL